MKRFILNTRSKGSSMIMFALVLVVILGSASISLDIGLAIHEKAMLRNATDAAALAGAQELMDDADKAYSITYSYLLKNGIDPESAEISILDEGRAVSVASKKKVEYFFARILGFENGEVDARATAKAIPVTSVYSGIRPFAIENMALDFGQQYVLKEGGGSGSNGNYGALALGGSGANKYKTNIIDGYDGELKVGDYVDTEPGNMSGPTYTGINTLIDRCSHSPRCTFDSFHPDCSRIVTVIMVDSLSVSGRKTVKIVGFASFFLEGVEGHGNKSTVIGRFIKTTTGGDTNESQADYGLRGIKLVQ